MQYLHCVVNSFSFRLVWLFDSKGLQKNVCTHRVFNLEFISYLGKVVTVCCDFKTGSLQSFLTQIIKYTNNKWRTSRLICYFRILQVCSYEKFTLIFIWNVISYLKFVTSDLRWTSKCDVLRLCKSNSHVIWRDERRRLYRGFHSHRAASQIGFFDVPKEPLTRFTVTVDKVHGNCWQFHGNCWQFHGKPV